MAGKHSLACGVGLIGAESRRKEAACGDDREAAEGSSGRWWCLGGLPLMPVKDTGAPGLRLRESPVFQRHLPLT